MLLDENSATVKVTLYIYFDEEISSLLLQQ